MSKSKLVVTVGVDEAGRGCLAGPVVAASVLLGPSKIAGLADSKKLTASKREQLAAEIIHECIAYSYGIATVKEIDELNILEATFMAMQRSVAGIVIVPDLVLVDGDKLPDLPYPAEAIIDGDDKIPEIMAASILAKQHRDTLMIELDKEVPQYGFAKHKGYGTKEHLAALEQHGVSEFHRRKFAPVATILKSQLSGIVQNE